MSTIDRKYQKLAAAALKFIENDDMLIANLKAHNDSVVIACYSIRAPLEATIKALAAYVPEGGWPQ